VQKISLNIAPAGPLDVDLRASLGVTSKSRRVVVAGDVERTLNSRRRRRRLFGLDNQQVGSNARTTRVRRHGAVRGRRGVAESPTQRHSTSASPRTGRHDVRRLNLPHYAHACVYMFSLSCLWAIVCKTVRPMLSDRSRSVLSVTLVYCGQTAGWIKMPLGTEVGLGLDHVVLDGDPSPPPQKKGGHSSRLRQFSAHADL